MARKPPIVVELTDHWIVAVYDRDRNVYVELTDRPWFTVDAARRAARAYFDQVDHCEPLAPGMNVAAVLQAAREARDE